MSELVELIRRLSEASGVSGNEDAVINIVEEELDGYVDVIDYDPLGNLIAIRYGETPSIMIAAHADEIGLMVKSIDDKGFISFSCIGGFFSQSLLNQKVRFPVKNGIVGVIGSRPPHIMKASEYDAVVDAKNMFIDIGATSKEDVESYGIKVGTFISIDSGFEELLNGKISGKALDNRIGLAVMIETMKQTETKYTVYGVASVQEEVGLRGARHAVTRYMPTVAIATDVTIPGDHPGITLTESPVELGKGAGVVVMDGSIIVPKSILTWIDKTAQQHEIPIQKEVSASGGATDAGVMHLMNGGTPCGVVSVPLRYMHSPVETASIKDVESTIKLMVKLTENIGEYFDGK